MDFINLTPHDIKVVLEHGEDNIHIFPQSGTIARVGTTQKHAETIEGVKIFTTVFGQVEGLPEPKEDTMFIVSGMVLSALNGTRPDVVAPAKLIRDMVGRVVKDANGNERVEGIGDVIGCEGLTR